MRCAVWLGERRFQIEDRASVEPGPGEVRLAIRACGVCLTEVHGIDGNFPIATPPHVLGHEFCGVVDAVGEGVALQPGIAAVGIGTGGFAEEIVLPANRVFALPDGVSLEYAALLEPLVACAAAVHDARVPFGSSVLITGAGPMGLLLVQLVKRGGAVRVFVSEPSPDRARLAMRLGADAIVDPRASNVVETIREQTEGRGVDASFETVGHAGPLRDCLDATRDRGQVVIVGVNSRSTPLELDLYVYHPRNLTLRWSWGPAGFGDFQQAVPKVMVWLRELQLEPLISHRYKLADIGAAFEMARDRQGLKVLVLPRAH